MNKAIKIFIADNEPDMTRLTLFRLKKLGFEVEVAENGLQAVEKIRKSKPDLIILDEDIPLFDGYKVCSQVRANDLLKAIPVVMLVLSEDGIETKMEKMGSNGFLVKPYSFDKLKEKIDLFTKKS